ncbi:CpaF family protein [Nocardiopsis changdeensis]|uniref:CpaF family protein n=1 Tax=Nocardiopsis changdeensis TaxID=2831969 RepID=A0ABX8BLS2_9ACTN|nr:MULTISPECIES: ATPase, T2SS/T4P/T4SS family [Nocardiopsis]QUX22503.1 CpaF family protein [Nocardiopsis changdeensis]QYX38445.1 Flp pilus assembly complex ATPase component TadA [Nocardiopsis sp. MT53]
MTATVPHLVPASSRSDELRAHALVLAAQITERLSAFPELGETPDTVARLVDEVLEDEAQKAVTRGGGWSPEQEGRLRKLITDHVLGLGAVEELLTEPGVENIHITGSEPVIVDFGAGRREERPPVVETDDDLVALVRRAAARALGGERRFDLSAPILSMELPGGERLSAIMPGIATRPSVTIRLHRDGFLRLGDLARAGTVDQAARDLLVAAVRARLNILISGATNAGKTTLLRALLGTVDAQRIITIEDSLELGLHRLGTNANVMALQGRPANIEGVGEVSLAELVRAALRMCPDRVIVGETRGPETLALLNAMSMGTDGSMSTIHASGSRQVFTKLAAYCAQSAERLNPSATAALVASALHLVVHLDTAPSGDRVVASIRQVVGVEGEQVISDELYLRDADQATGEVVCPPSGEVARRLMRAGYAVRGWV